MRPVKLLTLTTRYYLGIFLVLILFFFVAFYFISRQEVLKSIDEVLYNRKMHVVRELEKTNGMLTPEVIHYDDFVVTPMPIVLERPDVYSDTIVYEWVDHEWDEFRKLTSFVVIHDKAYRFDIIIPRLETNEIVSTIVKSLLLMLIFIVVAFYLATRYFSRKLWSPFYKTLNWLSRFEVEQPIAFDGPKPRIEEFAHLTKSIIELTERTRNTFISQKQFIENASHEMQTPLAITQSKLDQLISDPGLTQDQSEIVQALITSAQRLTRLNKTLILLSKIENRQFAKGDRVYIKDILKESIGHFEELLEDKHIAVELTASQNDVLTCNRELFEIMVNNLIKNAFVHNFSKGRVAISADNTQLSITNTSGSDAIPEKNLFMRFYKQAPNKESWGLGLSIAKRICDLHGWIITYKKENAEHTFIVTWANL